MASDFGNPLATTSYALCIYDDDALKLEVDLPPDGASWQPKRDKGFSYKDRSGANDGIVVAKLIGGDAGKAKLQVGGKGANVPPLTPAQPLRLFAVTQSVVAQLHQADGVCYETAFAASEVRKNDGTTFSAKHVE